MGLLDFLLMRVLVRSSLITNHAFVLDKLPETIQEIERFYKNITECYKDDEGLREDR